MSGYRPQSSARVFHRDQLARERFVTQLRSNGVLSDPNEVRERVRAEAVTCPHCTKWVHPDNWSKHFELYHPDEEVPVLNTEPAQPESATPVSLQKLDEARQTLAQLEHVDEVKAIRDKAEAMRLYAKQAQMGLEAQNHAAEIKLYAERRAGELLKQMKKNKGVAGTGDANVGKSTGGRTVQPPVDSTPKLEDLGINKSQSSRWQAIAEIPEEEFQRTIAETKAAQKELTSKQLQDVARSVRRKKLKVKAAAVRSEMAAESADLPPVSTHYELHTGDFQSILATFDEASIDHIITDPPYAQDAIALYGHLARHAARILKPGGNLVVMCGQSWLPEILAEMTPYIDYHWTLAYVITGNQSTRLFQRRVMCFWKPILWFVNGKHGDEWVSDVVKASPENNDTSLHKWQQHIDGFNTLVERFSQPGDRILDPMCGSGTTGEASLRMGRQFVGIDSDPECIAICKGRLAACTDLTA